MTIKVCVYQLAMATSVSLLMSIATSNKQSLYQYTTCTRTSTCIQVLRAPVVCMWLCLGSMRIVASQTV